MQPTSDREAFIVGLYTSCHDLLEKMCYRLLDYDTSQADLVADCIQEAFLAADRHWRMLTRHPNPQGWLVTTCQNRLKDSLRRERTRRFRTAWSLDEDSAPQVADAAGALDSWVDRAADQQAVEQVLRLLSPAEKQVMQGYFVDNLSMEEVADRQGSTLSAVKSAIFRIRSKAREMREKKP